MIKIKQMLQRGVETLTRLGFYSSLELPLEGAELHDVLDHLTTPPEWKVKYIPPTVEGEQLAHINSVAKRYVGGWMAQGGDPRIAIQHLTIPNKEELLKEAILYWYGTPTRQKVAEYYHENA